MKEMANITYIEEAHIFQCCNCGAHADSPKDIKHYTSCIAGESDKWARYYSQLSDLCKEGGKNEKD